MVGRSAAELEQGDRLLAAVLVLFGAAGTLVAAVDGPAVLSVSVAVVGFGGALLGVALKPLQGRAQEDEDQKNGWRLPPMRLRDLTGEAVYDLGVDSEAPESLELLGLPAEDHPQYLRRRIDEELCDRLRKASEGNGATLVVISGPSKAGKSRTALKMAAKVLPTAWLISPNDAEAISRVAQPRPPRSLRQGPWVIWIDDIEEKAQWNSGLNAGTMRSLSEWKGAVVVLATQGGKGVALSRSRYFREIVGELLARYPPLQLESRLEEKELEVVRERHPAAAETIARDGLGEFMIAAPRLVDRLRNGNSHAGKAIAWAAVDCRRAGLLRPLSIAELEELYIDYFTGAPTSAGFAAGLEWAAKPLYSNVALIGRPRGRSDSYAPHDYVVDWANRERRPLGGTIWDKVMTEYAEGEADLLRMAAIADRNGDRARAEAAWRRADSLGSGRAAGILGRLHENRSELAAAETAYRRAEERGDAHASGSLGLLLEKKGQIGLAADALQRSDDRGDPQGACWNGFFLQFRLQDLDGAEAAFRRAIARGHWHASAQLGHLLEEKGQIEAAETAYRVADEHGDGGGPRRIGLLLEREHRLEEAKEAFRRADERGDGRGAVCLGEIMERLGDSAQAEAAYWRSHKRGDSWGSCQLGRALEGKGDVAEAEAMYRHGHDNGQALGSIRLAALLQYQGELDEAEDVLRAALDRDPQVPRHLGLLLQVKGDIDGAESSLRDAGARGDSFAQLCLAELLEERGEWEMAELASARAEKLATAGDQKGNTSDTLTLGRLRQRRGDTIGAEEAFRRADEGGQVAATVRLAWLLAYERNSEAAGLAAYLRADARGSADGANGAGLILRKRGDQYKALQAFARADARGNAEGAFHLGEMLLRSSPRAEVRQKATEAFERSRDRALSKGLGELAEKAAAAVEELDADSRAASD